MSQNQKNVWRCPFCGTISELHVAKCPSCHTDLPIKGILITVDEAESEKERQARENEARKRKKKTEAAANQKKRKNTDGVSQKKNWLPAVLGVCVVVVMGVFLLPGLMSHDEQPESDGYLRQTQDSTEGIPVEGSMEMPFESQEESKEEIPVETTEEFQSESRPAPEEGAWIHNVLRRDVSEKGLFLSNQDRVFGSDIQRIEVLEVIFTDTLTEMRDDAWDVSAAGDGSVMAWAQPRNGGYILYIGAEGGINGEDACYGLFSGYYKVTKIDFNDAFHMGQPDTLCAMFRGCSELTELDVTGWDTSQVTDFSYLFSGCNSLTVLDVSGFDTSQAKSMRDMFNACWKLTSLDVSGFDTSHVTDFAGMFGFCVGLQELDVSGFETGDASNFQSMFHRCDTLKSLDLSGFYIAKNANVISMFEGCKSLTDLGVERFVVPESATTTDMYKGTIWE